MTKGFSPFPYTMSDSLQVRNNEYNGMYRGTVLDNDDPEHRGRCKVYVYGVYDEEYNSDKGEFLPWAEPSQPLFCGGNQKNGTFQCPDLSATVWVFFDSGDIGRPVMFGQTTDAKSLSAEKTYKKSLSLFDIDSCTMYWDGMYIEMYKPTHTVTVSSTNISAFASNDLSGHAGHNVYIDADNDINVYAKHDINVKADNNINIEAGVDMNIKVGQNLTEDVKKDITIKSGSKISEEAATSTTRKAPDNMIDGKLHITGPTQDDSTVNCSDCIANVSLNNHIHMGDGGPSPAPTSAPIG